MQEVVDNFKDINQGITSTSGPCTQQELQRLAHSIQQVGTLSPPVAETADDTVQAKPSSAASYVSALQEAALHGNVMGYKLW